jgi:CRP-like cAMP-binding protein
MSAHGHCAQAPLHDDRLARSHMGLREGRLRRAAIRPLSAAATFLGVGEQELVRRAVYLHRDRDECVVMPGDTPDGLCVVGRGAIAVTVPLPAGDDGRLERLILTIARPGDVLPLDSIGLPERPARFGAVALVPSTVVILPQVFVLDVLRRQTPETKAAIVAWQALASSQLLRDVCDLFESLDARLLKRLDALRASFPAPDDPAMIDPALGLTQTDIGELVASNRTSVNRALRRLTGRGMLNGTLPAIRLTHASDRPSFARSGAVPPPASAAQRDLLRDAVAAWADAVRRVVPISRSTVEAILRHAEPVHYERGQRIPTADDAFHTVLVRGVAHVKLHAAGGRVVSGWMARPGDPVGSGWIASGTAVVRSELHAHEPCIVATFRPAGMLDVVKTLDEHQLLDWCLRRHAALCEQVYHKCRLLRLPSTERLLYQLRRFARRFPELHPEGTVVRLDLTNYREVAPRILGGFVGCVPITAAKAFATLVRQGRISFVNGRILLRGFRPAS